MKSSEYCRSIDLPVSQAELWDWHTREGAFERLAPPWQTVRVVEKPAAMEPGAEVLLQIEKGPIKKRWRARIEEVDKPNGFTDIQLEGPFGYWRHQHMMEATHSHASRLIDRVTYRLPGGIGLLPLAAKVGKRELDRLFRFRQERLLMDLERGAAQLPGRGKTVLITGISGLIGSRMVPYLQTLGYQVRGLSRNPSNADMFKWDPRRQWIEPAALQGVDAVIHLAGENIASGRWTEKRRRAILDSRVEGTRCLVDAMAKMDSPPAVLISASGVNVYPSSGDLQDESSPTGGGFLGEVCREWEAQARRAEDAGVRVVLVRTGVVLDPSGGALGKMLLPYQLGLGGPIGSGKQGFPWIAMDDLVDVYERAIREDILSGPVNAVAPELTTQSMFNDTLARILRRPGIFRMPQGLVKWLFGQMGEEALLSDMRIQPGRLIQTGHQFRFETLQSALSFILGR